MLKHLQLLLLSLLCPLLFACATSPKTASEVQQGKRDFEAGYYNRALRELLSPATDGNREAQYAIGYMYYYGYGTAQDTHTGFFWIKKAADQHYAPAQQALEMISRTNKR